jgi:hypothetical protein
MQLLKIRSTFEMNELMKWFEVLSGYHTLQIARWLRIDAFLLVMLLFRVNYAIQLRRLPLRRLVANNHPLPSDLTRCMCVVFRMDDIQDSFVNNAQLEAMNLFSLEVSHYH